MTSMRRACKSTLSGMHVFDAKLWACSCGRVASKRDRTKLKKLKARCIEAAKIVRVSTAA